MFAMAKNSLKDLTYYRIKALDKLNTFRRIPLLICPLFFTKDFPITDIHRLVSLFGYSPNITAHILVWAPCVNAGGVGLVRTYLALA